MVFRYFVPSCSVESNLIPYGVNHAIDGVIVPVVFSIKPICVESRVVFANYNVFHFLYVKVVFIRSNSYLMFRNSSAVEHWCIQSTKKTNAIKPRMANSRGHGVSFLTSFLACCIAIDFVGVIGNWLCVWIWNDIWRWFPR